MLANEGLVCDPLLKNVKFLVVTIVGKGDSPNHTCFSEAVACCSCCCCCWRLVVGCERHHTIKRNKNTQVSIPLAVSKCPSWCSFLHVSGHGHVKFQDTLKTGGSLLFWGPHFGRIIIFEYKSMMVGHFLQDFPDQCMKFLVAWEIIM